MKTAASLLILYFSYTSACGGGSSSCSWTQCFTTYDDYQPMPAPGTCVWQTSRARHNYQTFTQGSGCPASTQCTEVDRTRYWCMCRTVVKCWWSGWGEWTGDVAKDTCGQQTRSRRAESSVDWFGTLGSCASAKATCPVEIDSEARTWCNCRKAVSCVPGSWTAWSPTPAEGKCVQQSRFHDYFATYEYVQQLGSCFGVNPNCPDRMKDSRNMCSCEYKECVQGEWTEWEKAAWNGNCPTERRMKNYRAITKFKEAHDHCGGIGPSSCPANVGQDREAVVTCPKLEPPAYGELVGTACSGVDSRCKAICQAECRSGFHLEGSRYVTCTGTGSWDVRLGICKDAEPPRITCPNPQSYVTDANKDYATIQLEPATASDNTGLQPKINVSHAFPLKVYVGKPTEVTYTAFDDSGNARSCKVTLEVKDTEPPKIVRCPEDRIITTGRIPLQVYWPEPQFFDNVDGEAVDKIPTHFNGDLFSKGKHDITVLARDKAFNSVKCTFTIQIAEMGCPLYEPPRHGSATCNIRKAGVQETYICTVSCKTGFWFLQGPDYPQVYHYYVCGENGQWRGQNVFDPFKELTTFFEPLSTDRRIWPDCSEGSPPTEVAMDFQVHAGTCSSVTDLENLKRAFVNALLGDAIIQQIYCSIDEYKHCDVENMIVYCSTRRKRDGSSKNQIHVRFTFAVKEKHATNSSTAQIHSLNSIVARLQSGPIVAEIKRIAPAVMKDSLVNTVVDSRPPKIACEPGSEMTKIDGIGSDEERTKCLKCSPGTYYESNSRQCKVCPPGFYQETEGKSSCTKCPNGSYTTGSFASNFTQCKEICSPGTFSVTGLASCTACPKGTYQTATNATSCVRCPGGSSTAGIGSSSVADCVRGAVDIFIRSEGFDDPGAKLGGKSNILVDGVDYSKHGRGYNVVILDRKTRKVDDSRSFDTCGDVSAAKNMLSFMKSAAQGKIVLVALQDDGTNSMNDEGYQALTLAGGREPLQRQYRSSYALIGFVGTSRPAWVQQVVSDRLRGPAELRAALSVSIEIEIKSFGCNDPGRIAQSCVLSTIVVDGVDRSMHGRGYNMVVLDEKTGNFVQAASFDTHADATAGDKMLKFVNDLSFGQIVLVAVQDEGTTMFTTAARNALYVIGARDPLQNAYRGSFALVGHRSKSAFKWLQQKVEPSGFGPAIISTTIPV